MLSPFRFFKRGDFLRNHSYFYDPKAAAERQKLYCKNRKLPLFAPPTGICWTCGLNIYYDYGPEMNHAYSVHEAGNQHITGCPYCHTSFCE